MTDSFVTQCPHCQKSFRVTHHQLSLARGVVRCGACLQVFNAARQLLEQSSAERVPAPSAPVPATLPATELAATEPPATQPPLATPVKASEALKPEHWAETDSPLDELDLDQALARLERRSDAPPHQFEPFDERLHARRDEPDHDTHHEAHTPFGTATDGHVEPDLPEEPAPPLIEPAPLDLAPAPGDRTEPSLSSLSLDLDDEPQASARETAHFDERPEVFDEDEPGERLSARDDEETGERLSARDDHDDSLDEPHERLEPGLAASVGRPGRKEPLIDLVDDPLQLDWNKPKPNWGRRLLWGALVLLAAALLAFQYIWFHFDEMARHDQYRPWFQQLCPTLGCKVPTRVDIARIKSSNLVVRSHPDFKGALIVDAIIYNRAPFAQPFPLLELRFADLNGQLIASRRFKPREYLSGELAGRGEMPSQTPIHIALDILDPGPKAVNYSLSFRSPE